MDAFNIEKRKIHLKHEPRRNFETSLVGPLAILVALVKRQIGQGSSNSDRCFGISSMSNFLAIRFSLEIETQPKH